MSHLCVRVCMCVCVCVCVCACVSLTLLGSIHCCTVGCGHIIDCMQRDQCESIIHVPINNSLSQYMTFPPEQPAGHKSPPQHRLPMIIPDLPGSMINRDKSLGTARVDGGKPGDEPSQIAWGLAPEYPSAQLQTAAPTRLGEAMSMLDTLTGHCIKYGMFSRTRRPSSFGPLSGDGRGGEGR